MLAAEAEGLVTLDLRLSPNNKDSLEQAVTDAWKSSGEGDLDRTWTNVRREIVEEAFASHLLPAASAWLKEQLRDNTETVIGEHCQKSLYFVSLEGGQ